MQVKRNLVAKFQLQTIRSLQFGVIDGSTKVSYRQTWQPNDQTPCAHVLHPTKEGQFPRDPIFFGQTPVFLEGPWSGDSETVGEIEKGVRIFLREPFSQWKQATRRKSPQWPNVAGTKFWLLFAYTYLFGTGIMWKKLTWQQFSIFGAFSPSEHVRSRFWQNPAEFSVGIGPQ